jgi:hypothetical protein
MYLCTSSAISGVAVRPVPMAHTDEDNTDINTKNDSNKRIRITRKKDRELNVL